MGKYFLLSKSQHIRRIGDEGWEGWGEKGAEKEEGKGGGHVSDKKSASLELAMGKKLDKWY